ncbi:DUF2637 domain-containing protein [Nocardia asteroides]|uniref:DUF2637 domain-containing protein n=1 Tax=Nocardia asteroides TaxID=1824 RepID=UPI001E5A785E|nr:DUF2637 domain-containing protein [Nocardia asteroides]UGT53767.1 DUF2637 domain-containing protein [Nocardia asteroides]
MDTADQRSPVMRWALWSAVVVLAGVGAAAFVVSFAALQDLAIMAGTPRRLGWMFPVIVDGTIIQATMAVIVLPEGAPERRWFSWVLLLGAAVSVSSNSIHAYLTGHGWGGALLAAVPPLALLVDTHGLSLLIRAAQRLSAPMAAAESEPVGPPEPGDAKPIAAEPIPGPDRVPVPVPVAVPAPAAVPAPVSPPVRAPIPPAPVRPTVPPPVRVVQPFQPPRPVAVPSGGN